MLNVLDAKIDGVITTAASVVGAPAAFLSASGRSQKLAVAKKSYLSHIDDAVELIKVWRDSYAYKGLGFPPNKRI